MVAILIHRAHRGCDLEKMDVALSLGLLIYKRTEPLVLDLGEVNKMRYPAKF